MPSNAYQTKLHLENVVSMLFVGLSAKNWNILKIRRNRQNDEERERFEENRVYHLKRHLYQNWKAENVPVVAGRLVYFSSAKF